VDLALLACELCRGAGCPVPRQAARLKVHGSDPVVPVAFRVGEAAATIQGAIGCLAARAHELRGGRSQDLSVDVAAAACCLCSDQLLSAGGMSGAELRTSSRYLAKRVNLMGTYPARDGQPFFLHSGFDPDAVLRLLGLEKGDMSREAIREAVGKWGAGDLEEAMAERGLNGAAVRSFSEWLAHPQGAALAGTPVVEVVKVRETPPVPLGPLEDRPFRGVRVLDQSRALAGPVAARTLAEHGATVLRMNNSKLPDIPNHFRDTSHGKHVAHLDLADAEHVERLRELVASGADVFSENYRAGKMEKHGFGPRQVFDMAAGRGIVYTSLNCYGHSGPWRERGGWEQLGQAVSGLMVGNAGPDGRPKLLQHIAPCDMLTGYLGALGTMAALVRRAEEGGCYHVRVSLSRTAMWLQTLGKVPDISIARFPPSNFRKEALAFAEAGGYLERSANPHYGEVVHLRPVLRMSETPPRWEVQTSPVGTHPLAWPRVPAAKL